MKCEPTVYSLQDLKKASRQTDCWEGVRNYQARNFMRDDMRMGDEAFFYNSNANPSGVAGLMKIVKEAYPDHSSWDKASKYYDPKSTRELPRWFMVDVQFVKEFKEILSLADLKKHRILQNMAVVQKGSRLSITPVTQEEFEFILNLEKGGVV